VNTLDNTIVMVIVLLAPVGLAYGWWFCFARMLKEPLRWRSRVTVVALGLVSVAAVMWPVAHMTAPEANWQTWAGVGAYYRWVEGWGRVAMRMLLGALVLSFFGLPRLIFPIVVACVGVGMFWVFTDIP